MAGYRPHETVDSAPPADENLVTAYTSLVNIGTEAQKITPVSDHADIAERSRFVESGKELLNQLRSLPGKEMVVTESARPNAHDGHGMDPFVHFKPSASLVEESCKLAIEKGDTESAFQNAVLLIHSGKSICKGGDSDDQTMGFVFSTKGAALMYRFCVHIQAFWTNRGRKHLRILQVELNRAMLPFLVCLKRMTVFLIKHFENDRRKFKQIESMSC